MNVRLWKSLIVIAVVVPALGKAEVGEQAGSTLSANSDDSVLRRLPHWTFTTKSYRQEALRLLIEEANRVAQELGLPEKLPITRTNLIEVFIQPPALGMFGTISTSNYAYYASVEKKFSGLDLRNQVQNFYQAREKYTWPVNRLNTNLAFQVATQMMAAVRMDVIGLNRDCTLEVTASQPDEMGRRFFVPDYWVTWRKAGEVVAYIEFVEPTRCIRQLHVWDPTYILRQPLRVPNLAELLNQTNLSTTTKPPAKVQSPSK